MTDSKKKRNNSTHTKKRIKIRQPNPRQMIKTKPRGTKKRTERKKRINNERAKMKTRTKVTKTKRRKNKNIKNNQENTKKTKTSKKMKNLKAVKHSRKTVKMEEKTPQSKKWLIPTNSASSRNMISSLIQFFFFHTTWLQGDFLVFLSMFTNINSTHKMFICKLIYCER